jgi:hypothetical protein
MAPLIHTIANFFSIILLCSSLGCTIGVSWTRVVTRTDEDGQTRTDGRTNEDENDGCWVVHDLDVL